MENLWSQFESEVEAKEWEKALYTIRNTNKLGYFELAGKMRDFYVSHLKA